MPKLVTNDDLKDALTDFREHADLRYVRTTEAGQLIDDELSLRGLTPQDVEELIREMSDEED